MDQVRRSCAIVLLTAVVVAAGGSGPQSAGANERAGPVNRHRVDLFWKPDEQDILAGSPTILDSFDSFGPPFGRAAPVETLTPRDAAKGTDDRSGTWRVFLTKGRNPGRCTGTFEIRKNYVETTATSQTVTYRGTLELKRCRGVRKFAEVRPGTLGKVSGRSVCVVGGCRGGLEITGSLRY